MTSDMRAAFRTLLKSPGFALIAIAALALGIGANTAIFSVVNQVLLNPAGVSNPERVAALRTRYGKIGLDSIGVSAPAFAAVEQSKQLFESASIFNEGDYNYTGHGIPERLQGAAVSVSWFDVFGVKPAAGRVFTPEEDQPNANQVIVLSYGAWTRIFGRDPSTIGRSIELNQKPYRIVGAMGPEFRWPARVDLWVPLGLPHTAYNENNTFNEGYSAYARLKPGVSIAQANAYIKVLNDRVRNSPGRGGAYAKASDWGTFVEPFTDFIAGNTKTPMLVLMCAVGFVLLIACSNVAGLMLARASGRAREIAVRAALGANRWNLIRQPLTESLLLSFCGAAVGLGVAYLGTRALLQFAPEEAPVSLAVTSICGCCYLR